MNIIYIHGLGSDANSTKGLQLEAYCKNFYPSAQVIRPDLNQSPDIVFDYLVSLVASHQKKAQTVLIGSSLGGYFATLVSSKTNCPALLLNPSTRPHISLQRFCDSYDINDRENRATIIHTTDGGWQISLADLDWFDGHRLSMLSDLKNITAIIKKSDELLDAKIATDFYLNHQAKVILQEGGDHQFTDFEEQLLLVMSEIQTLIVENR
ncbi:YqiA/YcfP family alpha/beta fold hydrolase [Psychrobacter ciconiae]|uniref:YqiA/YcfP family alpha/beta fold hydrolase n=1 Tax=Psychrobacter ciconiae TaxID=1553449 RepID=UPI0019182F79|nr:YqiA/YcfP family alpha/beta fold hydrolase [Psychrobacter ciconiae]